MSKTIQSPPKAILGVNKFIKKDIVDDVKQTITKVIVTDRKNTSEEALKALIDEIKSDPLFAGP